MTLALYLLVLGLQQHRACVGRHCGPNSFAICSWCSCAKGASLVKASFLGRRFSCLLGAGPHLFLLAMCFSQKQCFWKTFCSLFLLLHCCCETNVRVFFLFKKKILRYSHIACQNNRGDFRYYELNCFHMIQIQADLQACQMQLAVHVASEYGVLQSSPSLPLSLAVLLQQFFFYPFVDIGQRI